MTPQFADHYHSFTKENESPQSKPKPKTITKASKPTMPSQYRLKPIRFPKNIVKKISLRNKTKTKILMLSKSQDVL